MSAIKVTFRRVAGMSEKRKREAKEYAKLRRMFLRENPQCAVLEVAFDRQKPATDVHHSRGRAGTLYLDTRFWIPVSREGHRWIEENRNLARKLEWEGRPILAAVGKWNNPR